MRNDIEKRYRSFIEELQNDFRNQQQGHVKRIPMGQKIFPSCIPPQLEMVLLDPDDMTIGYRPTSDPGSPNRKKGQWKIGTPADAVRYVIGWTDNMKEVRRKADH